MEPLLEKVNKSVQGKDKIISNDSNKKDQFKLPLVIEDFLKDQSVGGKSQVVDGTDAVIFKTNYNKFSVLEDFNEENRYEKPAAVINQLAAVQNVESVHQADNATQRERVSLMNTNKTGDKVAKPIMFECVSAPKGEVKETQIAQKEAVQVEKMAQASLNQNQ